MFQSNVLQSYTDASDMNYKSPEIDQNRDETPRAAEAEINFYPDPRVSGIFQDHGLFKDLDTTHEASH